MKSKAKKQHSKNVFTDDKLKKYIGIKTFKKYLHTKQNHLEFDFDIIEKISKALKKWAIKNGATHYCHWFQPLTGKTAGKLVSFLEIKDGQVKEIFEANNLIKGETDASSFPNGGERMTFEARGYIIWDCTSPAVIQELNGQKVLLIPTAFCSYNSVALDEKTPLLKASKCLNKNATKLLNLLGHKTKSVQANIGFEQEYFLITKQNYLKREDLILTGRTLLGSKTIKSQECNHHYFSQISNLVSEFMSKVNEKLWKMGITAKIQHNEVAPCQYEIVPIYQNVNLASDQNQLIMETLQKTAEEFDLKVLLHEKPFNGINGSGKHTNWSVSTNYGQNLFDINQKDKLVFETFFVLMLSAIDEYSDLVSLSASHPGNDLRLGGDEAPPSIISVFIGDSLLEYFNNWQKSKNFNHKISTNQLLDNLPKITIDNCDRNRTSPFAFTGNKFEFRMVGSSQSTSFPCTILCTILSQKISEAIQKIERHSCLEARKQELKNFLIKQYKKHKKIIFNGNGYSEEWKKETQKRKLPIFKNCLEVYKVLSLPKTKKLFENLGVLTSYELKLRQEILEKNLAETIFTESLCLKNILSTKVFPALSEFILSLEKTKKQNNYFESIYNQIISGFNKLCQEQKLLSELIEQFENQSDKADFAQNKLNLQNKKIRQIYDKIEPLIFSQFKPFPNYTDILYLSN